MPSGSFQFPRSPMFNCSTVGKTGQRIGQSKLFQLPILRLNFLMEFRDSSAYCHSGQQLAWVKRLRQIVVSACSQTFYDLVLLRVASKQDDVGVGIWIAAYLPA